MLVYSKVVISNAQIPSLCSPCCRKIKSWERALCMEILPSLTVVCRVENTTICLPTALSRCQSGIFGICEYVYIISKTYWIYIKMGQVNITMRPETMQSPRPKFYLVFVVSKQLIISFLWRMIRGSSRYFRKFNRLKCVKVGHPSYLQKTQKLTKHKNSMNTDGLDIES